MRSTSVSRPAVSHFSLRHGIRALGAALLLAMAPGCPAPVVPDPQPQPPPPPVTRPPVTQTAPVLGPNQDFPGQKVIVVHQADLFGQYEGKQGQAITIRALLMMTKTQPVVGNKGILYVSPNGSSKGESDWVPLGDVEVKQPLDGESRIQLKMVDDEKKFVMPGGKKPGPLPRNCRMRLRWQW